MKILTGVTAILTLGLIVPTNQVYVSSPKMYSNGAVEEEIKYIDTSPEGAGDSIKFDYTVESPEFISSAVIQLDNGQDDPDDYTCTYTITDEGGDTVCEPALSTARFLVSDTEGELTFMEQPTLSLGGTWTVTLTYDDGSQATARASQTATNVSDALPAFRKCDSWTLTEDSTGETGGSDECKSVYSATCNSGIYPEPYVATVGIYTADGTPLLGDYVLPLESTGTDNEGNYEIESAEGTVQILDVTPKGLQAKLYVLHGSSEYTGDVADLTPDSEDVEDWVEIIIPLDTFDPGCDEAIWSFCEDTEANYINGFSKNLECNGNTLAATVLAEHCHEGEILPDGDEALQADFKCKDGVNAYWSTTDFSSDGIKSYTCSSQTVGWYEPVSAIISSCGYTATGAVVEALKIYLIDENEELQETQFLDAGLGQEQAIRFPIKIAEDEGYAWQQVIIYIDGETVVNTNNSMGGGFGGDSYPCEGILEDLCTLDISENPDDVQGYGSYLATLYLTNTTMELGGVWTVDVVAAESGNTYASPEDLSIEVIATCIGDDWGFILDDTGSLPFQLPGDSDSCDLELSLECPHNVYPQIDSEGSFFQLYSTTNEDARVELGRVGIVSEPVSGGIMGGEDEEYTFTSEGKIKYTVDNSSPKGLTPQLVVRNVEGDIYQAGPVAAEQMTIYNGDPDACPDVVSFCENRDLGAVQPLLPGLEGSLDTDLLCAYVDNFDNFVSVSSTCREEVKAGGMADELRVSFTCSENCKMEWAPPSSLPDFPTEATSKTISCKVGGNGYWQEFVEDLATNTIGVWPTCTCGMPNVFTDAADSVTVSITTMIAATIFTWWMT